MKRIGPSGIASGLLWNVGNCGSILATQVLAFTVVRTHVCCLLSIIGISPLSNCSPYWRLLGSCAVQRNQRSGSGKFNLSCYLLFLLIPDWSLHCLCHDRNSWCCGFGSVRKLVDGKKWKINHCLLVRSVAIRTPSTPSSSEASTAPSSPPSPSSASSRVPRQVGALRHHFEWAAAKNTFV